MSMDTLNETIIRQFEDLRMIVSNGIKDGNIPALRGVRLLEQLNATQFSFEEALRTLETITNGGNQ